MRGGSNNSINHTFEADGIQLAFGDKQILRSVYLKAETGRVTGIVGRNGSGKSSLFRVIYGTLQTVDKSVRIDGRHVKRAYENGVVYAPQHNFIPGARLVRNVLKDYKLSAESDVLMHYFPSFKDNFSTPVSILSGGERRILEIYITLVSDALFCILDEPFSQISPLNIEAVKAIINQEKQRKGVIISDHLYNDILDISDNLYILIDGETRPINNTIEDLQKHGYLTV